MNPILSICIPTFNRANWLLIALNSIINSKINNYIQICISNNASESDYSMIENLVASHKNNLIIFNYYKQRETLSIDENHQFVINMAKSEYVYLLGDDDFFLNDQLSKLLDLIINEKPNLAIFNGIKVDSNGRSFGKHFDLPHQVFNSIEDAFNNLRDKCSFGAVLTRKSYFDDKLFEKFYGTQHGYGIFWISLFEEDYNNTNLKILIPEFDCVALRFAQKSYSKIEIFYIDIPMWFNVFYFNSKYPKYKQLVLDYHRFYYNNVTSLYFLQNLFSTGNDISLISNYISFDTLFVKFKLRIIKLYNLFKFF